jgi:hypothetical protein
MSLAMFSISCMLVLFAYSSLSFLQLAFGEFGLLELCRLTLFKFHIKVLRTKRKLNSLSLGPSILTTSLNLFFVNLLLCASRITCSHTHFYCTPRIHTFPQKCAK